jgi:DNA mismatch endonuclease, patch repair protein
MQSPNSVDASGLFQALESFKEKHKMAGKGPLSLALVLTRKAASKKMPLDAMDFLTKQEGQVSGVSKSVVQSILKEHGITRVLAEEAGRTSGGSIARMHAYVELLNDLNAKSMLDFAQMEKWWIDRVKEYFASQPFKLKLDPAKSLRHAVHELMDSFSAKKRSDIMRKVRSVNTAPELLVRRLLHVSGYRFKVADHKLPGSPDIVLPKYKSVIFVHGCFWHRHRGCSAASMPASNVEYWLAKFQRNQSRDRRIGRELRRMGWRVIVVWECQTKNSLRLINMLKEKLTVKSSYELPLCNSFSCAAENAGTYKSRK